MDAQEFKEPSSEFKPWYYQDWFLFPAFVFWPLGPVLTIRSPWHNGFISGTISWALLFTGVYLLIYQPLIRGEGIVSLQTSITIMIPGIILTPITQFHWIFTQKPKITRNNSLSSIEATQRFSEDKPRSRRAQNRRRKR
tara:strand:+ start:13650 stop:14066 length:417 start_codon:yes stop_codon:yes gene_type:complete